MKIKYTSRIGGIAKVSYAKHTKEVNSFRLLHKGDSYHCPIDNAIREFSSTLGLQIPNGILELKPNSKVIIL